MTKKKEDAEPEVRKKPKKDTVETPEPVTDFQDDGKTISFDVDTEKLNSALTFINKHLKKSMLPVLENVHITIENNTLRLRKTDLNLDIIATIPCYEIKGDLYEFLVSSEKLQKIVNIASVDKLSFKITRKEVTIEEAWNTYVIAIGPDINEYISPKIQEEFFKLDIPAEKLKQILTDSLIFVVSGSYADLRPALGGVCVQLRKDDDNFYFVATDANSLYHNKISIGSNSFIDCSLILSAQFVMALCSLSLTEGSAIIHVSGDPEDEHKKSKNVWIEHGKYNIKGQLIDATYPAWDKIIPTNQPSLLTIDRGEFTNTIGKFLKVLEDPTKILRLIINPTHSVLQSIMPDTNSKIDMKMNSKFEGELYTTIDTERITTNVMGLNAMFVKNAASVMTGKNMFISMDSVNRAVIFRCDKPEDKNMFVLVMPLILP